MSDTPNGGTPTPPQPPNPWAGLGLPASFNPLATCLFRVNKIAVTITKPGPAGLPEVTKEFRYIVAFESMSAAFGAAFEEGGFAEFVRQCQELRSGIVLPGT